MNIINRITSPIKRFLGIQQATTSKVKLAPWGLIRFKGNSNTCLEHACTVIAIDEAGNALENKTITFRVVKGPLSFRNGQRLIPVKTSNNGQATVDVTFDKKGYAFISAELNENNCEFVYFEGYTEDKTDRLNIDADPSYPSDPGKIVVQITSIDLNGNPVLGADLALSAINKKNDVLIGEVQEIGNGLFEGILQTNVAGCWQIQVQDKETRVLRSTCTHVIADSPHKLKFVGNEDPRKSEPYDEVLLRVRLEDRYGNALNPSRIRCLLEGQPVDVHVVNGEEANFRIKAEGYIKVNVKVSDANSSISEDLQINFAAVWLQGSSVVKTNNSFETLVYGIPPSDRPANKATIEIKFVPDMVQFKTWKELPTVDPELIIETEIKNDLLIINVKTADGNPITAKRFPKGLAIGIVEWFCIKAGKTTFGCIGKMSPSTPVWEFLVKQIKGETKCVCYNIIYHECDTYGLLAGRQMAEQVEEKIGSMQNVALCCPPIMVEIKETPISAIEWANKVGVAVGADGRVSSIVEAQKFTEPGDDGVKIGILENCMNTYMVRRDSASWSKHGLSHIGPDEGKGRSVYDPDSVSTVPDTGAHEAGHMLGLRHGSAYSDTDNLMHSPGTERTGAELTSNQCDDILSNIDEYGC